MRVYGIVADEAHDNHGIVFEYLQTGTLQDGLKYLKRLVRKDAWACCSKGCLNSASELCWYGSCV
jgi:hypothetical protein